METAYREWEKRRQGSTGRHTGNRRRGTKVALGTRERRRLIQLAVCVVLFLVVFIGKGIFPDQLTAMRDQMLRMLRTDTDFTAAFSSLGQSFARGEPVLDTLEELWADVFGAGEVKIDAPPKLEDTMHFRSARAYLSGETWESPVAYYLGISLPEESADPGLQAADTAEPAPLVTPEPSPVPTPASTPEVIHKDYDGPALPENTTMDQYNLDLPETVSPVMGWVSSGFGWREHPVEGGEKFHNGVDLAVNDGTEVKAFASGVVDYIGDSPIYGKYLQLKHEGGVTTFYAHCSKLCVQQGEAVSAGQKVAESGETGNATGPHLHFELKRDGVRLNPLYYIETQ